METTKKKRDYNHLIIGLATGAVLIAYFVIMRAVGLAIYPQFRMFNFVILFAGVYFSMKHEVEMKDRGYFYRLADGCLTVCAAVTLFAVFLSIWLSYDTVLLSSLKHTLNVYLEPETAAITVFTEGVASGMIMAYVFISWTDRQGRATLEREKDEVEAHE